MRLIRPIRPMELLLGVVVFVALFVGFSLSAPKAQAATIRQEINILDSTITGSTASNSNEIVSLDTTKYSGTVTYYFEAVIGGAASNTGTVTLRRSGTTTDDATLTGRTDATLTRTRSTSFTPPAGATNYIVRNNADGTRSQTIKAARIIIIQNTGTDPLTATETQIEIGNNEGPLTNTTVAPLTNPKYWTYTAANWDGTKTFYAEVTYSTSSTQTSTIKVQEDDGAFGTWTDKVTIVNAVSNTSATRTRSTSFTPTDGRNYRLVSLESSATGGKTYSIYNAKIIVDQTEETKDSNITANSTNGVHAIYGSGGTYEELGQSFTTGSAYSLHKIQIQLSKVNSPTDNVVAKIYGTSMGGTLLATSNNIAASSVGSGTWVSFTFSSPIAVASGTKYYVSLSRSGLRDTTNFLTPYINGNYGTGDVYVLNNGSWSGADQTLDMNFKTFSPITKLEPQYLLLNTADSGSTGLQSYNTLYDTAEWSSVSATFKASHDATNASDATELTDITGSTYYFDVSDAAVSDASSAWTNDSNAFDGNTGTYASTSTNDGYLIGEGTNAPTTGGTITAVKTRLYYSANGGALSWSGYLTLSTPTGGWTWQKVNDLEVKAWKNNLSGRNYEVFTDGLGESLGTESDGGSVTSFELAKVEVQVAHGLANSQLTGANQQEGSSSVSLTDDHEIDVNVTNTTGVVTASRIIVAAIIPGPLDHYSLTVATPQTAAVCVTGTNTITAQDVNNIDLTSDTSTVNMTSNGTSITFYTASDCVTSTTTYTLSSGTVSIYYKTNVAQTFTITATKDGSTETGTSSNITVNPGSHTRLVITLPGQTFTAGSGNSGTVSNVTLSPFNIPSITATDDYFNIITSYTGAKTLAYSGPSSSGGTPSYTTSVNFTSGQSTTELATTLKTPETTTITAADGGQYGYASSSLIVLAPEIKLKGGLNLKGGTRLAN